MIQKTLADNFKVFHSTLQVELKPCEHSADGCNYIDRIIKSPGKIEPK